MRELIENRLIELREELTNLTEPRIWVKVNNGSNRRELTMLCENSICELEKILKDLEELKEIEKN